MDTIQVTTEKYNELDLANKLFCTFTPKASLEEALNTITSNYSVLYSKIFVLEVVNGEEFILTYNIDPHNSSSYVLPSTILLHRKKESNTLYTINGLNALIREVNGGNLDPNYRINWVEYRNTVLLTQGLELRKLQTKIQRIVEL
jgi:hypothetical protein